MNPAELDLYLEQTFDSFCKTVIRNESRNIRKRLRQIAEHESSISALTASEAAKLCAEDSYEASNTLFYLDGCCFSVDDIRLAKAISFLTPQRREIVLLSFFLGYSDTQISRMLNTSPDTIGYRKNIAIEKLRESLGGLESD